MVCLALSAKAKRQRENVAVLLFIFTSIIFFLLWRRFLAACKNKKNGCPRNDIRFFTLLMRQR